MPIYFYTARTRESKTETGTIEAKDENDLVKILREKNLVLTSFHVPEDKKIKKSPLIKLKGIFNRISLVEKLMFTRHLGVMVGSGFSLHKALETLAKQTENPSFKKVVSDLVLRIKRGESFADALAQYPKVFNNFFVSMVRVGEKGGTLEESLKILAQYLKKEHDFISKVRGAMTYPIVILVAMTGIGILMMVMVMPKLISMFEELQVSLPITTQILIATSKFFTKYFYIGIAIFVALAVFSIKFFKTKKGKNASSWFFLKLPFFNKIVKKMNCARFARSFCSLMQSGVSIVESLTISSETVGNIFYSRALIDASVEVKKGTKLQESIEKRGELFPILVGQMIGVGEETGELSNIIGRLADFYEEDVTNITNNLTSIIEPILMIFLGAAVGFFAISMIQPMYSMMQGM
ncbi:MAG: type II secretion system F family protein [Patescibacteria group bacterium]